MAGAFGCNGCFPCSNPNLIGQSFGGAQYTWISSTYCPQGDAGDCEQLAPCGGGGSFAAVEEAWSRGDVDALIYHIQSDEAVLFTPSRSAVHLVDCTGQVSRQLDLPSETVSLLLDADL